MKVCGITNEQDAFLACEAGAGALGFIFYEKSPRFIRPFAAEKIISKLPESVRKVGVFVNAPVEDINTRFKFLDFAQLHGDEMPEYCRQVALPVIKVFRVQASFDSREMQSYNPDGFLLDTYSPAQRGGTGESFDWQIAREASKYGKIILSGGLNADNVLQAVNTALPDAVDVNSGIEAAPGKKDIKKLKSFFKVLKETYLFK